MTRPALFAAALLGVLVLAAPAEALIQVDRGIAGARLGNTPDQVRAALGAPAREVERTNDFGPVLTWRYAGGVQVIFQGRTSVTLVSTTGLGDRTSRGVGVGSSERAVRRRVARVRCSSAGGGLRLCQRGGENAGDRTTVFFLRRGKVTRVDVGIVID